MPQPPLPPPAPGEGFEETRARARERGPGQPRGAGDSAAEGLGETRSAPSWRGRGPAAAEGAEDLRETRGALQETRLGPEWQSPPSREGPLGLESGSGGPTRSGGGRAPWRSSSASGPGIELPEAPRSFSRSESLRLLATRFELLGELGEGGMGLVLRARDATGRELAVKVASSERLTARSLERFRREGETTARLNHPGVLRVHAAGEVEGLPYLAYELIPACRTAGEVVDELDRRERITLLRDVAFALGYAHAQGVVHRDVKPDNILIDASGRAKVADFGLALMAGESRLTQTGAMVGTPYYMAPETFSGERALVGPPADVWALGVMLYRTLGGAYPFDGRSLRDLELRVLEADPEPLRSLAPDVDPALAAIVHHALEGDPLVRYRDGEALARDLDAWLTGGVISASGQSGVQRVWRRHRRKLPFLLALALGGAILGAALWATRGPGLAPDTQPPRVVLEPIPSWTYAERLVVRGRVEDEAPWVELELGRARQRVLGGQGFALEVRLRPGSNELQLQARDAAGNVAPPLVRRVERTEVPAWYRALAAEARPPLPLPPGVAFGDLPGDYRSVKDTSLLTWVPAGRFTMGIVEGGCPEWSENEGPPHEVTLTRGFFLGKLEVSRQQYLAFCEAAEHKRPPPLQVPVENPQRHPVTHVTYEDAQAYCAWAGLRLPSEAEWEWAARGPEGRLFPWGDRPPRGSGDCNRLGGDPYETTSPCGAFPLVRGPFGQLDMAGNVWEFVVDRYGPYPAEPQRDPRVTSGEQIVQRGGSWNAGPWSARATKRARVDTFYTNTAAGFRVALSYPEAR